MHLMNIPLIFAALSTGSGQVIQPPFVDWPQEPDGFAGFRLLSTKAEVGNRIKFGPCTPGPTPYRKLMGGSRNCQVTLTLNDRKFPLGALYFVAPLNTPDKDARLQHIVVTFCQTDYSYIKSAFIQMYGKPHESVRRPECDDESLSWRGRRTEIQLWSAPKTRKGLFVFSPRVFKISDFFDIGDNPDITVFAHSTITIGEEK
jgi:hypothetical protein